MSDHDAPTEPRLAVSRDHCPATGEPYPAWVARLTVAGVTWTYCHVCRTGDGAPQPHPYLERAHADET